MAITTFPYACRGRTVLPVPNQQLAMFMVEPALKEVLCTRLGSKEEGIRWSPALCLMSPNKDETAVHGCLCSGDMAVRMHEVLAMPRVGVPACHLLYCFKMKNRNLIASVTLY